MAKTTDETEKAIERLRGERDTYNKIKEVEALEEKERASLKSKEAFEAGWQWAHSASYEDLKNVAEGDTLWFRVPLYGDHDAKEFQAGVIAFFKQLPKD
jgi:hypothetical protein